MSAELSVVIPVYNEEEAIVEVIEEWLSALSAQTSSFLIHILNDGSRDGTDKRLKQLEGKPHLLITHHSNRGHGQTCVEGYRAACRRGSQWVLQIDSDGQCDPR